MIVWEAILMKLKKEAKRSGLRKLLLTISPSISSQTREGKSTSISPSTLRPRSAPCLSSSLARIHIDYSTGRRLIEGKVPLLSLEAIHQLHIFIFVLAVIHVVLSLIIVLSLKIKSWKDWEDSIAKEDGNGADHKKITPVHQFGFIRKHLNGFDKYSSILSWLHFFVKQFIHSVTKADYTTMILGFIETHGNSNPESNFYECMVRALEDDLKQVVGISWYHWIFVMVFLLLNVHDLDHLDSCIMGKVGFIILRLLDSLLLWTSAIIQLLCSYNTLPLYAIVTQMGSSVKEAIFDKLVQQDQEGERTINTESVSNTQESRNGTSVGIQLQNVLVQKDSIMEEAQG